MPNRLKMFSPPQNLVCLFFVGLIDRFNSNKICPKHTQNTKNQKTAKFVEYVELIGDVIIRCHLIKTDNITDINSTYVVTIED